MEKIQLALAIIGIAMFVIKTISKMRTMSKAELIDLACRVVEEAVVDTEAKMNVMKREAALKVGAEVRRGAEEVVKSPVKTDQVIRAALAPVREMAHQKAVSYIGDTMATLENKALNKILDSKTIDSAIKLALQAPKMGALEPLKTLILKRM